MLPDRVSNPGPLTYESGALPIALRGPAHFESVSKFKTIRTSIHLIALRGPATFGWLFMRYCLFHLFCCF